MTTGSPTSAEVQVGLGLGAVGFGRGGSFGDRVAAELDRAPG